MRLRGVRDAPRTSPALGPTLLVLALVLLAPTAGAWGASWSQPVDDDLSVRTSLLLAGDVAASGRGAFAMPQPSLASWDPEAVVRFCPDRAGEPDPDCLPSPATVATGATLRVLSGGLVVRPLGPARVEAHVRPAAALLGGAGVTLNTVPTGPALFAAGPADLSAEGEGFVLRAWGRETRVEVTSNEGVRAYEGAAWSLRVTNVKGLRLEGEGAVVSLLPGDVVRLARAGVPDAEEKLRVDDLLLLQRRALPPETPPRRADLADAFGPFRVVPALLDGSLAAHAGLTLGAEPQESFTLLRVERATIGLQDDRWVGSSEADYLVQGDVLAPAPGARVDPPILTPLLLAGLALAARLLTRRETAPAGRRRATLALRLAALPFLALAADLAVAPLLGVHPLLDGDALSTRSRAQLALLALGMALASWLLVGAWIESLARSAFSLKGRPAAVLAPAALGVLGCLLLLYLGRAPLLSLVARVVRL